ncbi:GDSL-type esterase/lipase family protein [Kitasatospora sp. NPDC092039]|uniref:GDSL-type esterase/lipase family protein n=1 Tax=Kitasatospora sp. NPDC092039 TaxID=3364086 RepID=UPI003807CA43
MPITIRPGSTVMFTGDSITDCRRRESEDGLGTGYPLRVAGEWAHRHPDRPVTWLNTANAGDKVMDLEARWRLDVLDARPDVLSVLVGVNDTGWHTLDPDGYPIPAERFEAGYDLLLPVHGVVEGPGTVLIGEKERAEWRADLDPKIQAVRRLARRYGAQLLAADGRFAELAATTAPEHWSEDGVHPTRAGHAALAASWLRLVT